MRFYTTLLVAILLTCVSPLFAQRRGGDRYANLGFVTGEFFPDIVLPEITTKKPTSLADFRGKKLIILHFASW